MFNLINRSSETNEPFFAGKSAQNTFIVFLLASLFVVFIFFFNYHLRVIKTAYTLDFGGEGAALVTTRQLLDRVNPFVLSEQPQHTQNYGIFYSLAAYPLALIWGSTLPVHRLVTAIFIWLACLFLFFILRKERIPVYFSLTASVIFYAQLVSLFTPQARPDSVGLFIFLLSVFIPWWRNFDRPSLIFSVAVSFIALLTKLYFILGLPLIIAYVFLFKSKKSGILLAVASLLFFIPMILLVDKLFPLYWTNSFYFFFIVKVGKSIGWIHMIKQLLAFSYKNFALMVILGVWLLKTLATLKFYLKNFVSRFNFKNFDLPLLSGINFDFASFALLFCFLAFALALGHNVGTFVDYIHHIISPFLLIVIFRYFSGVKGKLFIFYSVLLMVNLFFYIYKQNPLVDYSQQWRAVSEEVSARQNILNGPSLTAVLAEQNKPVYYTGHSFILFPEPPRYSPKYKGVKIRMDEFDKGIKQGIAAKKFDAIMIDSYQDQGIAEDLIQRYYQKKTTLFVPYAFYSSLIDVWEPKK